VIAAGGKSLPHTRAIYPANNTEMMYCTDPDGVRVELMRAGGETARFSHSGICVADVAASARFYEAIGFSPAENYELADEPWLEVMNELPGAALRAQMVRDAAGNTLELLYLYAPGCEGPREPSPLNRFGFNYLAFTTDDLDAAAAMIERAGGRALRQTRSRTNGCETLTCADPNGARLHLALASGT
jgi:predicted enzyme related to lactoylglutathione lyase